MFVDYHIHSNYSPDSLYPIEKIVIDAIELGLNEICITDHVDYGMKKIYIAKQDKITDNTDSNYNYIPDYINKLKYLRKKYKDKINIKIGQEFGLQSNVIDKYKNLFNTYNYDFILLSIHSINGVALWLPEYSDGRKQEEYNIQYYESLYDIVKTFKQYSVLAHFDVISRWDPKGYIDFEIIKPIITKILKIVINEGKGIELNISSRFDLPEPSPSSYILKLYKDLGGEIITFGTDTHAEGQLGANYKTAVSTLKKLGFNKICTFDRMKPIFHSL